MMPLPFLPSPTEARAKRTFGRFFTRYNPFENGGFLQWAKTARLSERKILEPFAGADHLIEMLRDMGLCKSAVSYDIQPKNRRVRYRDTLTNFPANFSVCITNPPYLAQNSARRRGLAYPPIPYDDVYKFALDKCLAHCEFVGAIIPASFLNAKLFRHRLSHYILLNTRMFNDTDHPVCLALFQKRADDVAIYEDKKYLGQLRDFERKMPKGSPDVAMRFNDKNGKLGLIAIDNTQAASIRFCRGAEIDPTRVGNSSRSITRIAIDGDVNQLIKNLNQAVNDFRQDTHDLFLTPFKGLRKDNKYRRRLDYALARTIISEVYADGL